MVVLLRPLRVALERPIDVEVPSALGAALWHAQSLAKAAHHKYIRRVPTGRYTRSGRPTYRYYYRVTGGSGIGHNDELRVGAAFRVKHADRAGHFHIIGEDADGKLILRHDESGHQEAVSREALRAILHSEHAEAIDAARGKAAADLEAARKHGSPKQRAAREAEAHKLGIDTTERDDGKGKDNRDSSSGNSHTGVGRSPGGGPGQARPAGAGEGGGKGGGRSRGQALAPEGGGIDPGTVDVGKRRPGRPRKGAPTPTPLLDINAIPAEQLLPASEFTDSRPYEPPKSPAIQKHEDLLPPITSPLPEGLHAFKRPTTKARRLYQHQIDAAGRCLTSWEKCDGFLLQDEAGLGKTNSAMAALVAHGGKRNVIVTPTAGKRGLKKQWRESADLYGVTLTDGPPTSPDQEGWFLCSYDEFQAQEKKPTAAAQLLADLEAAAADDPFDDGKKKKSKSKKMKLAPEWAAGQFDTITFDEAHNLSSATSKRAELALEVAEKAKKALYLSATPYTNVADMRYLTKVGLFGDGREAFLDWAVKAGARVKGQKVLNPTSALPMAAIAATAHVDGWALKRLTNMEGLTSKFGMEKVPAHAAEVFRKAESIFEIAAPFFKYTDAFRSSWSRQYWETLKIPAAIELGKQAIAEGKQVAFFTSFKTADHAHLRALPRILQRKAEQAAASDNPAKRAMARVYTEAANKISEIIDSLPPVDSAVQELVKAFGGPGMVAEIHGDTSKKPEKEQEAYQDGLKQVCVATMARGGTGISLHDTVGDAPRVQINLSLPWSGREFNQVAGRSHRLGSKSETTMHWLIGDSDLEQHNAAIVADRLKKMGSLTTGDPHMTLDAAALAAWEWGGHGASDDDDDSGSGMVDRLVSAAEEAEQADSDGDVPDDEEVVDTSVRGDREKDEQAARRTRSYFRAFAERRALGADVLGEEHKRRLIDRHTAKHTAARRAALQMATGGYTAKRVKGEKYRITVPRYGHPTEDHVGAFKKHTTWNKQARAFEVSAEALPKLAEASGYSGLRVDPSELGALRRAHDRRFRDNEGPGNEPERPSLEDPHEDHVDHLAEHGLDVEPAGDDVYIGGATYDAMDRIKSAARDAGGTAFWSSHRRAWQAPRNTVAHLSAAMPDLRPQKLKKALGAVWLGRLLVKAMGRTR